MWKAQEERLFKVRGPFQLFRDNIAKQYKKKTAFGVGEGCE